jgi:hypothetical protein
MLRAKAAESSFGHLRRVVDDGKAVGLRASNILRRIELQRVECDIA